MLATRELVFVFSILGAGMIVAPVFALKVTEPTASSHGYPGLCDMNGKKLANGEFRQWVEDDRLHVVITYKFSAGEVYGNTRNFDKTQSSSRKNGPGKNRNMDGRSESSLWIFWLESPAHTSAKIIRMCPKGLKLNRDGRLPGLDSALP